MAEIRVTGASALTLNRGPLDRALRAISRTGDEPAERPVCAASTNVLVLEDSCTASACEHAEKPIATGDASIDVRSIWASTACETLRRAHADNELPSDHCGACIARISNGLSAATGIVRDYGRFHSSPSDSSQSQGSHPHSSQSQSSQSQRASADTPTEIVVKLGPNDAAEPLLEAIAPVLDAIQTLRLVGDAVFACAAFAELAAAVANADDTAIAIRTESLPADSDEALELLRGAKVADIELVWSDSYRKHLGTALELADPSATRLRLAFSGQTWFRIHSICAECADLGVRVDLRADTSPSGLIALPLAEQRFVVGYLADSWSRLSGPDRPPSLAATSFETLLAEVRSQVRTLARDSMHDGPARALQGRGKLRWPALDAPELTDESIAIPLVRRALDLRATPSVLTWVHNTVRNPGFEGRAKQRPWLRFLLQSAAIEGRDHTAIEALRALYGETAEREALLAAEIECAERAAIDGWIQHFHGSLGLTRLGPRRAPFAVRPRKPKRLSDAPDVTVLIPSYRHEDYIEDAIRSVLAQTYGDFRLVVADDQSPDATVERARSIDDPRLEVRVNSSNLGLGNGVLAAIEECDTPFVALLNSDDLFHKQRLERCRAALLENPNAQLAATDLYLIDAAGGRLTTRSTSRLRDGIDVFDWVNWFQSSRPKSVEPERLFGDLLASNFLATSTNLFCRTDFLRAQADTLRSLKYCLDWQLFLEAACSSSLIYLPERLASYRLHASNTVWFREGRRWSYFLEVNRVVAATLTRFYESTSNSEPEKQRRLETLRLIASKLADNVEVDGLGLFVNSLLGGVPLEQLSESDDAARELIEDLNSRSERMAKAFYALRDAPAGSANSDFGRLPSLEVARILGELRAEEVRAVRDRAAWLEGRTDQLQREHGDLKWRWNHLNNRVGSELDKVAELLGKLAEGLARLDEEAAELRGDVSPESDSPDDRLGAELARLYQLEWRINRQLEILSDTSEQRDRLQREVTEARELHDGLRAALEQTRLREQATRDRMNAQVRDLRAELEDLGNRLRDTSDANQQLEAARIRQEQRRTELRQKLEAEHESAQRLRKQRNQLRQELQETTNALAATRAAWREEIHAIHRSREWRTGRFLWQKLPLVRKATRFAGRMRRRSVDLVERVKLRFRKRSGGDQSLKIVAGSTATFPVYSHTFVYQELLSFHTGMGADVELLYRNDGPRAQLQSAFRYLDTNKTQVTANREISRRDLEYYRKHKPQRLASLLEALAEETGKPVEELEKSDELLSTFTFARRIELIAPDYLHSYFYYDQSLNALVAQWLLGIPRGVSTYADHMMADWPLKVVPLHMRTADVIVATSQRIKDELCAIGGAQWADKIIVKPNGVDGSRFPYRDRQPLVDDRLELISVSRLEPKKGLCELVESIAMLRERGQKVRVHVIGTVDPPTPQNLAYRERFDQALEQHGVVDSFVMHGFKGHEQLTPLLMNAHAFVAPYVEIESGDKDGIPTAVLEAMSSGLPIVATDAGSLCEVIDHGVEGWVVPRGEPAAFARVLEQLYRGADFLREFGRRAHERFEREFDATVTEARLHARLREVLAKRAGETSS